MTLTKFSQRRQKITCKIVPLVAAFFTQTAWSVGSALEQTILPGYDGQRNALQSVSSASIDTGVEAATIESLVLYYDSTDATAFAAIVEGNIRFTSPFPERQAPFTLSVVDTRTRQIQFKASYVSGVDIRSTQPGYIDVDQLVTHKQALELGTHGRHEILLRFEAGGGRENRARLAVPNEPLNVFSGAVAAFSVPVIDYHVAVGLNNSETSMRLTSQLINSAQDSASPEWKLAWQPQPQSDLVVQLSLKELSIIAPAHQVF